MPVNVVMTDATWDCEPTLNDQQVIDFCKNGYLLLEGVVPGEVNRRVLAYLSDHSESDVSALLGEPWFVESVIRNPQAAGAVRSLLGSNCTAPQILTNHRFDCPRPVTLGWHRDGGATDTYRLSTLGVFYYPQDTPRELGPTELLPSSHFLRTKRRFMLHYGNVRKGIHTTAPAGSIFFMHYSLWHRPSAATANGVRHMLRYNVFRTAEPRRDWVMDPGVDFAAMDWFTNSTLLEKWHDSVHVARMFLWLCGQGDDFTFPGGYTWPLANRDIPRALAGLAADR